MHYRFYSNSLHKNLNSGFSTYTDLKACNCLYGEVYSAFMEGVYIKVRGKAFFIFYSFLQQPAVCSCYNVSDNWNWLVSRIFHNAEHNITWLKMYYVSFLNIYIYFKCCSVRRIKHFWVFLTFTFIAFGRHPYPEQLIHGNMGNITLGIPSQSHMSWSSWKAR